jgi:hypothetical protein
MKFDHFKGDGFDCPVYEYDTAQEAIADEDRRLNSLSDGKVIRVSLPNDAHWEYWMHVKSVKGLALSRQQVYAR